MLVTEGHLGVLVEHVAIQESRQSEDQCHLYGGSIVQVLEQPVPDWAAAGRRP